MTARVLLADPEETLLDTYRSFLTRHGFEVETATTGPDCLTKLHDWNPDVLVLEPDMPGDWADKILDDVGRRPKSDPVPVLLLTRREESVAAYPVCECHVKPLSMIQLAKSINAAVRGH